MTPKKFLDKIQPTAMFCLDHRKLGKKKKKPRSFKMQELVDEKWSSSSF